jgi:hexulose-6-phosphate isomerase
MNRREFLAASAGAAAALSVPAWAQEEERPKRSLILGMLPDSLSLEERFALARPTGFEGIEVEPTVDAEEQDALRAAAEKTGLPIHSIIFGWLELHSPDPKVREEGIADGLLQSDRIRAA